MRTLVLFAFLTLMGLGVAAQDDSTLVFVVRKPNVPGPEAIADLPVTIQRTYAGERTNLSINETIKLLPGTWMDSDTTIYNGSPLEVKSFRLFFQYDQYIISLEQQGCTSGDLLIVLDRLKAGKVFYVDKIIVYNPRTKQSYRMMDEAWTFVKN